MKKLSILFTLCTIVFSSFTIQASDLTDLIKRRRKSNKTSTEFTINLAPIAFKNFSINGFRNFNKEFAFGGTIGYMNFSVPGSAGFSDDGSSSEDIGYSGFYIAPEFRIYFKPSRNKYDGFFAGVYTKFRSMGSKGEPYLGFSSKSQDESGNGELVAYDIKNTGQSLGITLGRVFASKSGFVLSTWSGIGYYLYNVEKKSKEVESGLGDIDSGLPTMDFRVGFCLGYRF